MAGLIDIHSHLLPGVDDGCENVEASLACAREMVAAGYTHMAVTPHVWPSNPHVVKSAILQWATDLQAALDAAQIHIKLIPGGELNQANNLDKIPPEDLITYGMKNKYVLFDLWADVLPDSFDRTVAHFLKMGIQPILAHPERMSAVQRKPDLVNHFAEIGLLLQGNLQCLGDPAGTPTNTLVERYLKEDRYFMLGSDLHRLNTVPLRMAGLKRAREIITAEQFHRLTQSHPAKVLGIAL